jgi:hypothetical protein
MATYRSRRKTLEPFYLQVQRGKLVGYSSISMFGRNADIDTAQDEDVWDGGGDYIFLASAETHTIQSDDSADTSTGSGARSIVIEGLDGNYNELSASVTMSGTGSVLTTASFLRVHRMFVNGAGACGFNAGSISAFANSSSVITSIISACNNQSMQAIFTVPASKTGYILVYYFDINKKVVTGAADVDLLIRPPGQVFQVKHHAAGNAAGTSHFEHVFGVPFVVDEKSDLRMRAGVTVNSTDVTAGFDMILINNE